MTGQLRLLGVMDIVASTRIAIELGPSSELRFKRCFTDLVERCANEREMVLISSTGDGFVFSPVSVDHRSPAEQLIDFIGFCGDLRLQFASLLASFELDPHQSGLRFGLALTEVAIEWLPGGQVHLGGAGVSLVTRLCSLAEPGESVLDAQLGRQIHRLRIPLILRRRMHHGVRGFQDPVLAYHSFVPLKVNEFHTISQAIPPWSKAA